MPVGCHQGYACPPPAEAVAAAGPGGQAVVAGDSALEVHQGRTRTAMPEVRSRLFNAPLVWILLVDMNRLDVGAAFSCEKRLFEVIFSPSWSAAAADASMLVSANQHRWRTRCASPGIVWDAPAGWCEPAAVRLMSCRGAGGFRRGPPAPSLDGLDVEADHRPGFVLITGLVSRNQRHPAR